MPRSGLECAHGLAGAPLRSTDEDVQVHDGGVSQTHSLAVGLFSALTMA